MTLSGQKGRYPFGILLVMENAFIRAEWLKPMEDAFVKRRKKRNLPVFGVGVGIEDLQELIRCYIEPLCRYQDHVGNAGKTSCSAFDAINLFMGEGVDPNVQGGNQMLVLGDSGTGKTSLLRLLKLARDLGFRPVDYACAFIQIGNDSSARRFGDSFGFSPTERSGMDPCLPGWQ